jgi:hypothetical protein
MHQIALELLRPIGRVKQVFVKILSFRIVLALPLKVSIQQASEY